MLSILNRLVLIVCIITLKSVLILAQQTKPNLVFVFSDQQSFDMLGCYGNEQIKTPVIDELASEGVRFNYCISSNPVCSPYRAMLLTGQHVLQNGVFVNDIKVITDDIVPLGQALKNAGYRTGYVGKWHLLGGDRNRAVPAGPDRLGFDTFLSNNCTLRFGPEHAFYFNEKGEKVKFNKWEVSGQTDQVVDFINEEGEDPFAIIVSYHAPHDQGVERYGGPRYNTIPELMNLYNPDSISLRPNTDWIAGNWGSNFEEIRADYHGYYAMCSGIDNAMGQIIKALKEKGVYENTIIVYTSDHGDLLHSHQRPWPKSFPEDASCRVPLIVSYPNKAEQAKVSNTLVGTLDLMPTVLGLMDVEIPDNCVGTDLSKSITEKEDIMVESVPLFYFERNWRGVFTERYTFAFDNLNETDELFSWNVLYDRNIDPYQQHNLFYDPNYSGVRQELFEKAVAWMDKYEDPMIGAPELFELCEVDHTPKLAAKGKTGELSARPADLIKATNYKSKIPARMPNAEETKVLLERVRDREIKNTKGVYQEKIDRLNEIDPKTHKGDLK